MARYLMRTYDTYWNDVVREKVVNADNDDSAINVARMYFELLVIPSDRLELQIYHKGLSKGEWHMFAAMYYCEDELVIEDCYC